MLSIRALLSVLLPFILLLRPVSAFTYMNFSFDQCPAGHACVGDNMVPCLGRQYQPLPGQSTCLTCPKGSQLVSYTVKVNNVSYNYNVNCIPCPAGTFWTTLNGQELCQVCPDGQISSGGQTSCTPCPTNTLASPYRTQCIDPVQTCPTGTYTGNANSCFCNDTTLYFNGATKTCDPCADGYSCNGSSYASICSPGQVSAQGGATCTQCPAGTVNAVYGSSTCTTCTNQTYQDLVGQVNCKVCPPGYYVSQDRTKCLICPSASRCPGDGTAYLCLPGTTQCSEGSVTCNACPAGTFSTAGASACIPCSGNTVAKYQASATCTACDANYIAAAGNQQCVLDQSTCGPDASFVANKCVCNLKTQLYNPQYKTCSTCPDGNSCDGSEVAVVCAAGSTAHLGAGVCTACAAGSFSLAGDSTCRPCTGKYYQPGSGANACLTCEAGSYVVNNTCVTCLAGNYCPGDGSTYPCASGTYSPALGAFSCTPCLTGTYQPLQGQSSCRVCTIGNYVVNNTCLPCPAGKYCAGSGIAVSCPAGYTSTVGSVECTACPPGTYTTLAGSTECSACAESTIAPNPASTVCMACNFGYTSNSTRTGCVDAGLCGPNASYNYKQECICKSTAMYFVPATLECLPCPAGSSCDGSAVTTLCPAGRYSAVGSGVCDMCKPNTFSEQPGAGECEACPKGYYQPQYGQTECICCEAGNYISESRLQCLPCPAGSYCYGLGEKRPCSPGFHSLAGSSLCTRCPAGTYTNYSGQVECRNCAPGYVSTSDRTGCTACPAGSQCSLGLVVKVCPAGTYATSNGSDCVNCPVGTYNDLASQHSCKGCVGDSIAATTGSTACTACPAGQKANSDGSACVVDDTQCGPAATWNGFCICTDSHHYYDEVTRTCEDCPAGYRCLGVADKFPCPAGMKGVGGICTPCPAGSFSAAAAGECTACKYELYQPKSGQSSCLTCEKGSYVNEARTECLTCPAGYMCSGGSLTPCHGGTAAGEGSSGCSFCTGNKYSGATQSECSVCPAGSYVNFEHSECKLCDAGYYCPGDGLKNLCDWGTYSGPGQSECTECPVGHYADGWLNTECEICPQHTIAPTTGSHECTPCPTNYTNNIDHTECIFDPSLCGPNALFDTSTNECVCNDHATYLTPDHRCEPCPAGYSCDGTNTYTPCSIGSYSPQATAECVACPAGRFSLAAASGCTPCLGAKFMPSKGASTCLTCPLGNYVNPAHTQCMKCPTGSYCPGDGTAYHCPAGYFQPSSGESSCIECSAPGYQPATGANFCLTCTSGKYVSSDQQCVTCPAGYYCPGNGAKMACPNGSYSTDGAATCTPCSRGTRAYFAASTECEPCQAGSVAREGSDVCTLCPTGTQPDQFNEFCETLLATCGPDAQMTSDGCVCPTPGTYFDSALLQCAACPAGYKCDGSINVTTCPAGTFGLAGSCIDCYAGQYQINIASTACIECERGFYQPLTGQTKCEPCPAGTTSNTNHTLCIDGTCPAGTFWSPELGDCRCQDSNMAYIDGACIPCPAGSSCNGTTAVMACLPGQVSPTGIASCYQCPEGYQPNRDSTTCVVICTAGTFDSILVKCVPARCPAGTTLVNGQCTCMDTTLWLPECGSCGCRACPCGFACNGTSEMVPCAAGMYSTFGAGACVACATGAQPSTDRCSCQCE